MSGLLDACIMIGNSSSSSSHTIVGTPLFGFIHHLPLAAVIAVA
jgi:hypothetical protein